MAEEAVDFGSVEESTAIKSDKKSKSHSSSSSSTSPGSSTTTAAIMWLMVQQGKDCALRRLTNSSNTTTQLVCAGISPLTTYFSERPHRVADTGTTTKFVEQFPTLFASPTAAITCSAADGTSVLLVVSLTAAELVGTTPARRLEYTIEQSESQREASSVAMDTVLPLDNTYTEQTTMTWELGACSLFIDSAAVEYRLDFGAPEWT